MSDMKRDDAADVQATLDYANKRHLRMVRELADKDARIAALEAENAAISRVIAGQGTEILKLRQELVGMEARAALKAQP